MENGGFTLVLALALVTCVTPTERKCQLSGLWRNEQDSLMEISAVRDNGDFHGKYLTRVTLAGGCARASPLKGAQQQPGEGGWPTFAFSVRWDKFSTKQSEAAVPAWRGANGRCWAGTGQPLLTQRLCTHPCRAAQGAHGGSSPHKCRGGAVLQSPARPRGPLGKGRSPRCGLGGCMAVGVETWLVGPQGRGSSQRAQVLAPPRPQQALPPDATTAFAGQCFVDTGGKETLTTMWLLREAVGSLEEDWKATRVGRNIFTRKRTPKGKILPNLSPSCEDTASPAP